MIPAWHAGGGAAWQTKCVEDLLNRFLSCSCLHGNLLRTFIGLNRDIDERQTDLNQWEG